MSQMVFDMLASNVRLIGSSAVAIMLELIGFKSEPRASGATSAMPNPAPLFGGELITRGPS